MYSSNISGSKLVVLKSEIEYKKDLIGLKLGELDFDSVNKNDYDAGIVEATGNQVEYLEQCGAVNEVDGYVSMFYNALCVLYDCLGSGDEEKVSSAIIAYKKINPPIDSAISSMQLDEFVADNVLLDYIEKVSKRRATKRLNEIV